MAEFTSYDFSESIAQTDFTLADVEKALAAWGQSGDWNEWNGGFLLKLKDGRTAYIEGWCDTTGWGCQDGVETRFVESVPEHLDDLLFDDWRKGRVEWEREPADLNRLIAGEIKEFDREGLL